MDLFVDVFARHARNQEFLSALEAAARRSDQLERLLGVYEQHVEHVKPLHGRSIRIRKQLAERQ